MTLPPSSLWIAVKGKHGKRIKFWLPLFLIWPVGVIFALLAYAIYFLFFWLWIWNRKGWQILRASIQLYDVICSMKGMIVDVQNEQDNFAFCIR